MVLGWSSLMAGASEPSQQERPLVLLPEGVSEVHTPPLQLLGVVRRHVGELPEDVQVGGVP